MSFSLWPAAFVIAGIAGLMAIVLYYMGLREKNKKYARSLLIWATLFLGVSFGGLEWGLYLLGYVLFYFFAFPLMAFFAVWFAFIIWAFERVGARNVWIVFLIALIGLSILAVNCLNCLSGLW